MSFRASSATPSSPSATMPTVATCYPPMWETDHADRHVRGDVRPLLREPWDLVVAHPPCTYMCNSGVRWLDTEPGRWKKMLAGAALFRACLNANSPRTCVENPVMHGGARAAVGVAFTQTVQPWQFGHRETKRTCLWLKGLPPLVPTDVLDPKSCKGRVHHEPPGKWRWLHRSVTYTGIAAAMAVQWGGDARG